MIHGLGKVINYAPLISLHNSNVRSCNFPHGAMHRFMSSAASSSSGRVDQPPIVSSSSSNVEQPATPSHLKILYPRVVQRWLADEPITNCNSADAQRIRQAVAVLSRPNPRKENAQPLQIKWQVLSNKIPRPLGDVLKEFQGKVIQVAAAGLRRAVLNHS